MARNVLQYDGKTYTFAVSLEVKTQRDSSQPSKSFNQILDGEQIIEFRYENKINELVPNAQVTYLDKQGVVDKFSSYQYVKVCVSMSRLDIQTDGDTKKQSVAKGESVNLTFYLDNIEIKDSKPQEILYTLHLIGTDSLNLNRICRYSSYPKEKRITEHMKEILTQGAVEFDTPSFTLNESDVSISHISNGSDTIYDTMRYLQKRQYYEDTTEKTIKTLIVNDRTNKICMFDASRDSDWQSSRAFKINMIKNSGDIFASEDGTNIAFVGNKPNMETYKSQFPRSIYRYDIEKNSFGTVEFGTKRILNLDGTDVNRREQEPEGNYTTTQSYWNNNQNIYLEHIENMIDNSGLKINVAGVVGIVPGDRVGITISYDCQYGVENKEISDSYRKKFLSLSGDWFVSRVVYRVLSHDCKFRQIISLMRLKDVDVLGK